LADVRLAYQLHHFLSVYGLEPLADPQFFESLLGDWEEEFIDVFAVEHENRVCHPDDEPDITPTWPSVANPDSLFRAYPKLKFSRPHLWPRMMVLEFHPTGDVTPWEIVDREWKS
jgi:hypothetical protein